MIRNTILLVLTLISSSCGEPPTTAFQSNDTTPLRYKGDHEQPIVARLQGIWRGVSRQPADVGSDPSESTILIDGNKAIFLARDQETTEVLFRIDATVSPMQITWVDPADQPGRESEMRTQIFKVEGDELIICSGDPGEPTPTEFVISKQDDWILSSYRKKHR